MSELDQDEHVRQVRFCLPTYIRERYGVPPRDFYSDRSSTSNTSFEVLVKVQMSSFIDGIFSPSHVIGWSPPEETGPQESSIWHSTVTFSSSYEPPVKMNSDFVLCIIASDINKPRCVAEVVEERNTVALSLTLVPQFGIPNIQSQEYIFVIDRSGSMSGSRMKCAKETLQILLKELPEHGTSFNIVSFGSSHQVWKQSSLPYNNSNCQEAVWIFSLLHRTRRLTADRLTMWTTWKLIWVGRRLSLP